MNGIPQTVNPLDSRQLNAFVTLVQTGSFAETARHLCLTQSAISHSMRALESEIGCRLLVRMGKTVAPTEAGETLLHHAVLGLNELAAAKAKLEKLRGWGTRRLRIGASSLINRRLLPGILVELRRQHPRMVVTIRTVHPLRQADQLQNGELDCVISEKLSPDPEVEFTPLFESLLQIVVPSDHRWIRQQRVPLDELAKEPCVLPERFSPLRKAIEWYFSREKRTPNGVLEVENLETIREMVKAGLGISILPAWIIQNDVRLGHLHTFATGRRTLSLTWGFHTSRSRPADLIQSDFRALCATMLKPLLMVSGSAAPV
jgi:LysR family transcriptional regulator, low CO2-responsive transcriptional regulator